MYHLIVFVSLAILLGSCQAPSTPTENAPPSVANTTTAPVTVTSADAKAQRKADHKLFHATLRKHTTAIANRDIGTLESLMSPDGQMHLLRPNTEVVYTTDNYLKYHRLWFEDENWSLKSSITDSEVGTDMGVAITDVLYEVPERDGKPYWNKMVISYVLKKYDGAWYVISDHSTSVKKSTD